MISAWEDAEDGHGKMESLLIQHFFFRWVRIFQFHFHPIFLLCPERFFPECDCRALATPGERRQRFRFFGFLLSDKCVLLCLCVCLREFVYRQPFLFINENKNTFKKMKNLPPFFVAPCNNPLQRRGRGCLPPLHSHRVLEHYSVIVQLRQHVRLIA